MNDEQIAYHTQEFADDLNSIVFDFWHEASALPKELQIAVLCSVLQAKLNQLSRGTDAIPA